MFWVWVFGETPRHGSVWSLEVSPLGVVFELADVHGLSLLLLEEGVGLAVGTATLHRL